MPFFQTQTQSTTIGGMAQHLEPSAPQLAPSTSRGSFSSSSAAAVAPLALTTSSPLMLNNLSDNFKTTWSGRPFGLQLSTLNFSNTSKAINPNIKGFHQCHNAFRSTSQSQSCLIQIAFQFSSLIFPLQKIASLYQFLAIKC